jgi:DNA-binding transcriptional MerR regulator
MLQKKLAIPKPKESFSTLEAAHIAGLPVRTVDYWASTGFIPPSIADSEGRGTERKYAFGDLVALRIARDLRKQGISLQALRDIVERLRATKGASRNPLADSRLIAVGSDVTTVNGKEEVMSVLNNPGQGVFAFVFDRDGTVKDIEKTINKARKVRVA